MSSKSRIWVCHKDQLLEGSYQQVDVLYANEPSSVIIFRYKGDCIAYRNLCVHMPRRLDGEKETIFDETGHHLRCSMHGILYEPVSGASVSTICHGEKLTPVKLLEDEDGIWIFDKRVKPAAEAAD